jgi:D-3-phosphoglycerate dehydrogenase / 2-oxoglutarate reductase
MKNLKNTIFIFDIDSTLVKTETLDDIIGIAINDGDQCDSQESKELIIQKVKEITDLGMNGEINFQESLNRRFESVQISQKYIDLYNDEILLQHIDFNFKKIIEFIYNAGGAVFIVSGGFMDNVSIVARELGVGMEATFANEFIKDRGIVIGFDNNNKLINNNGKVEVARDIKSKHLYKKVICVGDGNSDYLIKKSGVADEFWGFWGNVQRNLLIKKADRNFYSSEALLRFIVG